MERTICTEEGAVVSLQVEDGTDKKQSRNTARQIG